MRLKDKVAIVTAAGRGIGRGIALRLAEAGAQVVVNSYTAETTAETVRQIEQAGGKASYVVGDITNPDKMLELRDHALSQYGKIDILVNNVGAGPKQAVAPEQHELGPVTAVWNALYAQNLLPVVQMTEAVLPSMRQRREGKIVIISSIAGRTSLSEKMLNHFVHPSYGAMKAALINYTQTLAELAGPDNINANAVCPGIVYTDAWKSNAGKAVKTIDEFQGQQADEWFAGIARGDYPHIFGRTPLQRPQTVEDIGNAVLFLVSENAINITGQSLMVDGGMVKI